jgi:hypothetical protein
MLLGMEAKVLVLRRRGRSALLTGSLRKATRRSGDRMLAKF